MEPVIPEAGKSLEEPPPFFASWQRVYASVLCYLVVLIAVLYLVSREFAY